MLDQLKLRLGGFLSHHNVGDKITQQFRYKLEQDQNKIFANLGFDRLSAIKKLNVVLLGLYGQNYNECIGMWSEHLVLFSALSEGKTKIENVLEIGTFNGETASILSRLFPDSKILTIDLPYDEILNVKMYRYSTKNEKILRERRNNLSMAANVVFRECNSIDFILNESKFDLIWIDGDHSYPTAAIDIANSLRLLADSGIIVCDDVYLNSDKFGGNGKSSASFETLNVLKQSNLADYVLLNKRIGYFFNYPSFSKKYLGVLKRSEI